MIKNIVKIIIATLFITSLVGACAWDAKTMNPQSSDYPCGTQGVNCWNGSCCWQGDICGYNGPGSICPKDACCSDQPIPWVVLLPPSVHSSHAQIRLGDKQYANVSDKHN